MTKRPIGLIKGLRTPFRIERDPVSGLQPIELGESKMSPAARISRPDVDWKDQTLLANPYPWYADSRRNAPVHHVRTDSGYEMWRCFRYDDILEMLRSSNSQTMGFPPEIVDTFLDQPDSPLYALARVVSSVMLIKNGKDHSRLRSLAAKALFACDELTGFIFAVTYVRPSRSIHEVKPKSVKKKLKQASFAASVNRADIEQGITEHGVDRDSHIQFIIDALRVIDEELGLRGDVDLSL